MTQYKYRDLRPTPEAENIYKRWIAHLDDFFTRRKEYERRAETVRAELHQLFIGRPHGGKLNINLRTELPFNVMEVSLDPRNITLEPEYYGDIDEAKYYERKPLIYFWQMFDRSPVALNHWLGFRFRCMLARHIFKSVGKNVKFFHGIEVSFGYNLTIEDDCVIHKYVHLDDRGELIIRKGSSISDFSAVFSHKHDAKTQSDVTNVATEIGPRARLTYHSAVMAGVKIKENAMLGAMGLATKDIPENAIFGGIPAKQIRTKDEPRRDEGADNSQPAKPQ